LSSFEAKKEEKEAHKLSELAPWDSHLVNVEVHPNATLVNHSLLDANLRQRFGINIVAIHRGIKTLVAPKPNELLMPGDILVVLGTDVQIDNSRPELEVPSDISTMMASDMNYRLRHLKVTSTSAISGKTIRQSQIREKYHAMVVGVERAQKRIINPDTDTEIIADDVIWVVGEKSMLEQLFTELA
jgi:CPA2 family monovalent cation:H+ antiporter-2